MVKSFFFTCVVAILLMSCNNQGEELISSLSPQEKQNAFLVPENQAVNQALAFFSAQEKTLPASKRAKAKRRVQSSAKEGVTTSQAGVYIINFEDNGGFAVVSADKRDGATVYLASPEGRFDENDAMNQELLSLVSDYQNSAIASYSFNPDKGDGVQTETTVVMENYGPLLSTCWHQGPPYNETLINLYGVGEPRRMGCVPVAIGQIINYFHFPNSINGEVIRWDYLSLATGNETNPTLATRCASNLLYILGTDMGLDYPSGNNPNHFAATQELQKLGYSYSTASGYNLGIIKAQVALMKPVYMDGEGAEEGHAWVADGYRKVKTEYRMYDDNGNLVENTDLNDYNYDTIHEYLHLNLGWGGAGLYNVSASLEYSSSTDHRMWVYSNIFNFYNKNQYISFNNNIRMIYNISH
ncbi:MAG: C10 family peptidase [Bacteroidales bacterium]|nr:C10 family peptidase [Bacteroidales bacterium]